MIGFQQDGDSLTLAADGATARVGGTPYLVGSFFGLAIADADANTDYVLKTRGVFSGQPKATGGAWTIGQLIYWDDTAKKFTHTSATGANKQVGAAVTAQASGDTSGTVKLGIFTV
jgi:predicted RecA/RadA family phage recombinase